MNKTYYLLNFPRPIGIEPTIYLKNPIIEPIICEVELGYFLEDPYSNPEILEFNSIFDTLTCILSFNSTDDYLKNIKVENKNDILV